VFGIYILPPMVSTVLMFLKNTGMDGNIYRRKWITYRECRNFAMHCWKKWQTKNLQPSHATSCRSTAHCSVCYTDCNELYPHFLNLEMKDRENSKTFILPGIMILPAE
jgi:hypothetical protein